MEGRVPCTVILQSIKIPCLKKRWEMAAIQNLGAWGSICWAKFLFGLQENKSLINSSCPCPEGVREDTSRLWTSPPARDGSRPQGHRATRTRASWKLPAGGCAASGISSGPFPISRCAPQRAGSRACSGFMCPQGQKNECMCWGHEPFLAVRCYSNGIYR